MAAISPYVCAFVCSIASSSERMPTIGAIGPKVSCVTAIESRGTSFRTVGCQYSSVGKPSARLPPVTTVAPRSTASATCASILAAPGSLFTGPIVVASSSGSPSRTSRSTSPASSETNSSRTASCTRMRSAAEQLWPAPRNEPTRAASAAAARSASSSTTSGPLPPISSSCAFPAAWRATISPVSVEPVNATACVPGLTASSSPTSGPGPSTKLKTPGGRSASAMHSASSREQTAVEGAGVHTTVLPQASAGASTSAGIVYGQFHGVISPSTPSGRRTSSTRRPGVALWGIEPSTRFPSSAAMRKNSMSSPTSTSASAFSGLPWSSVSTRASSSARLSITSAARWRNSARSNPVRAPQDGKAAFAAAIARRASARSPSATGPSDSPVAGLVASTVAPLVASRHSPSMNIRVVTPRALQRWGRESTRTARAEGGAFAIVLDRAPYRCLRQDGRSGPAEGREDLALEREHVLMHDRPRVRAVSVEDRLEELHLVVDGVAERRHAVEHQIPNAQRVREVPLERLPEVRVVRGLPREAVDLLVEAHQALLVAAAIELFDLAPQRLGLRARLRVEPERRQFGGVCLELGAHLGDALDVGGLDGGDERAPARLHVDQVLQCEPLHRLAERGATDAHLVHQRVLAEDSAGR